jgi:hypothetical protein
MTDNETVLAGLTSYGMTRDLSTGAWIPSIYDNPGKIHAVRPMAFEPALASMRDPYFIEETYNYRQSVCGITVKVILPLSFKPAEDNACPKCAEQLATGKRQRPAPHRITPPE